MGLKLPGMPKLFGRSFEETSASGIGINQVIDFITETGELVQGANNSTSGRATVYTVAAGKVLYLTAATLSYWHNTGTPNEVAVLEITTGFDTILSLIGITAESTQSISVSFAIPLRLGAGETVSIVPGASSASNRVFGQIVGYLLDA